MCQYPLCSLFTCTSCTFPPLSFFLKWNIDKLVRSLEACWEVLQNIFLHRNLPRTKAKMLLLQKFIYGILCKSGGNFSLGGAPHPRAQSELKSGMSLLEGLMFPTWKSAQLDMGSSSAMWPTFCLLWNCQFLVLRLGFKPDVGIKTSFSVFNALVPTVPVLRRQNRPKVCLFFKSGVKNCFRIPQVFILWIDLSIQDFEPFVFLLFCMCLQVEILYLNMEQWYMLTVHNQSRKWSIETIIQKKTTFQYTTKRWCSYQVECSTFVSNIFVSIYFVDNFIM